MGTLATTVLGQADDGTTASTAIGWVIFGIIVVGFAAAVFLNMRKGRKEVGAEIELAANRRPYLSDEELEGPKLDRTLGFGLVLLAIIAVALPVYWLGEPGRHEGAEEMFLNTFVGRGETLYDEGAQCADCHGPAGSGGAAETPLLNERGEFIEMVSWQAPALDTALYRYSREEVYDIITYGRPNTPMAPWGIDGGGPLTEQQIWNIVDYLEHVQKPAEEARAALDEEIERACAPDSDGTCMVEDGDFETLGEALFDLGLHSNFASGAYSCGRCHTAGWSYGDPSVTGGGGNLGPNLTGGLTLRQFPSQASQEEFVSQGAEARQPYGVAGQAGDGQMPGFGLNPNIEDEDTLMHSEQVMYTEEEIRAVVEFERDL